MISTVYLVLVITFSYGGEKSVAVEKIPQANMQQCQVNQKAYSKDDAIRRAFCIVGVK
ncbi:hypothetical protein [Acinetobacter sp. CFCC 10889]|uniref:hypothetical protein n=1 Tax=Acinetobacter sp. CFCC 10889 TaxID=1775557 RepID=UPI0013A6C26A|nr:hypothetical protein [Acinetobacter sp. CFCC 10889]